MIGVGSFIEILEGIERVIGSLYLIEDNEIGCRLKIVFEI